MFRLVRPGALPSPAPAPTPTPPVAVTPAAITQAATRQPRSPSTPTTSAPGLATPLPAGLSPRTFAVLRLVGVLGPAPFVLLERLVPALVPDLARRRSLVRLMYRELERLEVARFVATRRLPLAPAGVYFVTPAGACLLRAHDAADVPDDSVARFLACPDHETALRQVRAELLLARFETTGQHAGAITSLVFNDRARFELAGTPRAYEPDGHYELALRSATTCTLLVELDRGTRPTSAWRAKLEKGALALDRLTGTTRFAVIALGPQRLETLLGVAAEVLGARRGLLRGVVLADLDQARLWSTLLDGLH